MLFNDLLKTTLVFVCTLNYKFNSTEKVILWNSLPFILSLIDWHCFKVLFLKHLFLSTKTQSLGFSEQPNLDAIVSEPLYELQSTGHWPWLWASSSVLHTGLLELCHPISDAQAELFTLHVLAIRCFIIVQLAV